jgi:hypothetical protein
VAFVAPTSYADRTGSDANVVVGLNNDRLRNGLFYRVNSTRIAAIIDLTSQNVTLLERAWGGASPTTWEPTTLPRLTHRL